MLALATKYEWPTACRGVELHSLADRYEAFCCSVSVKNDQLVIDSKEKYSDSLTQILSKLSHGPPVALNLTGKGILIKKTTKIDQITADSLNHVFPNLKAEQFYIQNFISGEHSYISVIRRKIIDELIEAFSKAGLRLLTISLGPFAVSQVLNQFNNYGPEILFDGHLIHHAENYTWEDYTYVPGGTAKFPLKIDTEPIADSYVMAYAVAFQLALYNRLVPIELTTANTTQVLKEFREELKFRLRLTLALGVFFTLLLVNFLLSGYYNSANTELLSQVSKSSAGIEDAQKFENKVKSGEKILKEMGWNRGIKYAWLSDQIGQTVPSSVALNNLAINPPDIKNSSDQQKESYDTGKILVKATGTDLQAVNDWIILLRNKPWIQQAALDNYVPAEDGDAGEFNITIKYQ